MHMPGHKRNIELMHMANPYLLDITEIEGFDNLHQPEGILKELSEQLSRIYGAVRSFPLVNGSTAGNLVGISAAVSRGDRVLIARNSHKSVYHGVIQMGLKPVYYYPPVLPKANLSGGILAEELEEMLITYQDIKLVVITSPTYEGVVSDIRKLAEIVHSHGALLLVDEAHGAHFGFHEAFPRSAVTLGADLVIQSLHKTLPAFTQTAVLHCNRPELISKIQRYLAIYESSSPSYVLMSGIDRCLQLLEERGQTLFEQFQDKLKRFYEATKNLKSLKVLTREDLRENLIEALREDGIYNLDPSKIIVSVQGTGITGHQLLKQLYTEYHIVMEMAAPEYALGMTSICDTEEGFLRLAKALQEIDNELTVTPDHCLTRVITMKPIQVMTPQEAVEKPSQAVSLKDCNERISAAFISLYPPGIPLLVPGERINRELQEYMQWVNTQGFNLTGLTGDEMDEIEVVQDERKCTEEGKGI